MVGKVDSSFPKGAAFAKWLELVGASVTSGELIIQQPRKDAEAAIAPAQRWISTTDPVASLQHYTFNTPVLAKPEAQCGRVVFSDFHVSAMERVGNTFPQSCKPGPLSAQEKALEFMLFDLSSCIQKDKDPPKPPPK